MTTLVIHGTMAGAPSPMSAKWWWTSWGDTGFLYHLRRGAPETCGSPLKDIWKVRGIPVSETPEIINNSWNTRFKKLPLMERHKVMMGVIKLPETYWVKNGYYLWTGSFSHNLRKQAGRTLARYLNIIKEISPKEKIRIVAHSHGCNVVKMASSSDLLNPSVHIERAIFLACPHFKNIVGRTEYPYDLNPVKFGKIINLYSAKDSVQVKIAQSLPGPPDNYDFTFANVTSSRCEQNPEKESAYLNYDIPMEDRGIKAHTAMHGGAVGKLCSMLLSCENVEIERAYDHFLKSLAPVPEGDFGE